MVQRAIEVRRLDRLSNRNHQQNVFAWKVCSDVCSTLILYLHRLIDRDLELTRATALDSSMPREFFFVVMGQRKAGYVSW
jgi:hypothetical protein